MYPLNLLNCASDESLRGWILNCDWKVSSKAKQKVWICPCWRTDALFVNPSLRCEDKDTIMWPKKGNMSCDLDLLEWCHWFTDDWSWLIFFFKNQTKTAVSALLSSCGQHFQNASLYVHTSVIAVTSAVLWTAVGPRERSHAVRGSEQLCATSEATSCPVMSKKGCCGAFFTEISCIVIVVLFYVFFLSLSLMVLFGLDWCY